MYAVITSGRCCAVVRERGTEPRGIHVTIGAVQVQSTDIIITQAPNINTHYEFVSLDSGLINTFWDIDDANAGRIREFSDICFIGLRAIYVPRGLQGPGPYDDVEISKASEGSQFVSMRYLLRCCSCCSCWIQKVY